MLPNFDSSGGLEVIHAALLQLISLCDTLQLYICTNNYKWIYFFLITVEKEIAYFNPLSSFKAENLACLSVLEWSMISHLAY